MSDLGIPPGDVNTVQVGGIPILSFDVVRTCLSNFVDANGTANASSYGIATDGNPKYRSATGSRSRADEGTTRREARLSVPAIRCRSVLLEPARLGLLFWWSITARVRTEGALLWFPPNLSRVQFPSESYPSTRKILPLILIGQLTELLLIWSSAKSVAWFV